MNFRKMATSRLHVGLGEDGRVGSKTTRIQPPGGMSHINSEMVAVDNKEVVKQFNRVLKPPGGGSSSAESVFSDGASVVSSGSTAGSSMASSPNESRASSTSPKTPAKKYHMKSNFELGDEQPVVPTVNTPRKKSSRPSIDPLNGEVIGQRSTPAPKRIENLPKLEPTPAPAQTRRVPPGGYTTPLW